MSKSIFRKVSKKIFVAFNLLLAVAFLFSCYGGFFFNSYWWPVAFFPIMALYVFLALFLFFVFWLLLRSKWSLLFLLITLVCLGPLRQLIAFRSPTEFVSAKKQNALRVMSWNVAQFDILESKKNPRISRSMFQLIRDQQPDVACFQEMVAGDSAVNLNTPYYKKYSFFPIAHLANSLGFRQYHYSYNDKEDFLSYQHFGLVIFSRYPIIHAQKISFLSAGYNNFFQFADIVTPSDTVRVFNIHLQSLKFNRSNRSYIDNPSLDNSDDVEKSRNVITKFKRAFAKRKIQTDYIREAIQKSPYPVIVCGDFNDVPNSYAYQQIGKGLLNCFAEKGSGIGRTFSAISPTLRIDNIFVSPFFQVDQYTRINRLLSDHFPIVADVLTKQQ